MTSSSKSIKIFCPICQCKAEHDEDKGRHDYVCYNEKCPLDHFSLVTRKQLGFKTSRAGQTMVINFD